MSFVTYAELLKGTEGSQFPEKALEGIRRITQRIAVVFPDEHITDLIWQDWTQTLS